MINMAITIVVAAIVITIVALFIPYWRSVWKLPSGRRPLTPEYNRLGQPIGLEENPGYEEAEPEQERREDAAEETERNGRKAA